MIGKFADAPRGGGSAQACVRYILGEELTQKASAKRSATENAPLTAAQKTDLEVMFAEARSREDLGAQAIWSPAAGKRPSSVYARGVASLETAAAEMEAGARTQPRVKAPVQHIIISLSEAESARVGDETLIRAAEFAVDRAGFAGHQAVFAVHRDTPDAHVHVTVGAVHPETLRAWTRNRNFHRLHEGMRYAELAFGLEHDNGLAVVRDPGLPSQRVEWATAAEREAWARERNLAAERLEDKARSFIGDSDGLETPEDRRDRVVFALRKMLVTCDEREERPLAADVYLIAAEHAATIERDPQGELRLRLMQRAEPTVGGRVVFLGGADKELVGKTGTVRAIEDRHVDVELESGRIVNVNVTAEEYRNLAPLSREDADELGDATYRIARWVPSDHVFDLRPEEVAPGPLDDGSTGTIAEGKEQAAADRRRAWLAQLGDVAASEQEVVDLLRADPGRVSRDLVAGSATFTAEDVDRWTCARLSDGGPEWSDYVLRSDATIRARSLDTEHPLLTTAQHLDLEERVFANATRLSQTRDPLFDAGTLERAIADVQKAKGLTYSEEQRAGVALSRSRFGVIQGDAGTGKSDLMAIVQRYGELMQREVVGLATAQLAAENLGKKAKIKSVNSARGLALERARGKELIPEGALVIVDETSMFSLEAADAILERVERAGAIALFIGDEAQLPNIEAGDTMRVLAAAAKEAGQYVEVTEVFRQAKDSSVEWMRAAIKKGAQAIREGDAAGVRDYFRQYVEHGHIVFHENRKDEIAAKAEDLIAAAQRGERVIAPGFSHVEALFVNRQVRRALGHEGTGVTFRLERGVRELAPGVAIHQERGK